MLSTTVFQMNSILSLAKARFWSVLPARALVAAVHDRHPAREAGQEAPLRARVAAATTTTSLSRRRAVARRTIRSRRCRELLLAGDVQVPVVAPRDDHGFGLILVAVVGFE